MLKVVELLVEEIKEEEVFVKVLGVIVEEGMFEDSDITRGLDCCGGVDRGSVLKDPSKDSKLSFCASMVSLLVLNESGLIVSISASSERSIYLTQSDLFLVKILSELSKIYSEFNSRWPSNIKLSTSTSSKALVTLISVLLNFSAKWSSVSDGRDLIC